MNLWICAESDGSVFPNFVSEPTESVKVLANDNVVVRCYMKDIGYYYNHSRVNVLPTRFATGIPLKVIETFVLSIPAVVSLSIYEQLAQTEGKILEADSTEQWIDN